MVGESLHRRGYRQQGGVAPLKENLAAALLLQCDWPGQALAGNAFVDPMCGSGTLLIEAALIALRIAPAYLRQRWCLSALEIYDDAIWQQQWRAVGEQVDATAGQGDSWSTRAGEYPLVLGSDIDERAIEICQRNIDASGLGHYISLRRCAGKSR